MSVPLRHLLPGSENLARAAGLPDTIRGRRSDGTLVTGGASGSGLVDHSTTDVRCSRATCFPSNVCACPISHQTLHIKVISSYPLKRKVELKWEHFFVGKIGKKVKMCEKEGKPKWEGRNMQEQMSKE
jgi:hypothetical protein